MPTSTSIHKFSRIALPDLVGATNQTFAERMKAVSHKRAFTFVDLLCGGGGSSAGLAEAGGHLMFGANHSKVAIATHERNFPDAAHESADLNHYDMRNLPEGVDILWASVICTEVSPSGGKKRRNQRAPGQLSLLDDGPVEEELFERTRATAQDVIRAAELWRFPIVAVENVVEFVRDWQLFGWWLQGMEILGYRWQIMSASSAHLSGEGNLPAPQWRDRVYIVFVRNDLPELRLSPRPSAYCPRCDRLVDAHQVWKDPRGMLTASGRRFQVGKYGLTSGQYFFACPIRGHGPVEPLVRPASSVIDWSDCGTPLGERRKPLVPTTMARIRRGIDMVRSGELSPAWLDANGGSYNTGPAWVTNPFRARTTSDWEGLVAPPAGAFIDTMRKNTLARSVGEPMTTTSCANNHGLVIPYRKNNVPSSVMSPTPTVSTVDSMGLLTGAEMADVNNWSYRMVSWIEQGLTQRFPMGYELAGNQGERIVQVGNAVSSNAAHYLGVRFAELLAGRVVMA